MKTNLFNVKERRERRIIIEEERTKNPFLLFFKKYKNFILTSGIMIALCFILASTGIAFSLFRGSNDYDITYIEGDETISTNKDPTIDEEDIKDGLLLTLTFHVAEGVVGDIPVGISYESGNIFDKDLNELELTTVNGTITVIDYVLGDADKNGRLNTLDITAIRRYISDGRKSSGFTAEINFYGRG